MSEETKQPAENTEVVRELVIPSETQMEFKSGDRSPTKDRDLTIEVLAAAETVTTNSKDEVVRTLVVPESQCEEGN